MKNILAFALLLIQSKTLFGQVRAPGYVIVNESNDTSFGIIDYRGPDTSPEVIYFNSNQLRSYTAENIKCFAIKDGPFFESAAVSVDACLGTSEPAMRPAMPIFLRSIVSGKKLSLYKYTFQYQRCPDQSCWFQTLYGLEEPAPIIEVHYIIKDSTGNYYDLINDKLYKHALTFRSQLRRRALGVPDERSILEQIRTARYIQSDLSAIVESINESACSSYQVSSLDWRLEHSVYIRLGFGLSKLRAEKKGISSEGEMFYRPTIYKTIAAGLEVRERTWGFVSLRGEVNYSSLGYAFRHYAMGQEDDNFLKLNKKAYFGYTQHLISGSIILLLNRYVTPEKDLECYIGAGIGVGHAFYSNKRWTKYDRDNSTDITPEMELGKTYTPIHLVWGLRIRSHFNLHFDNILYQHKNVRPATGFHIKILSLSAGYLF